MLKIIFIFYKEGDDSTLDQNAVVNETLENDEILTLEDRLINEVRKREQI